MERVHRELGDPAWIRIGGQIMKGHVVHIFDWCAERQYVVEIQTPIDPVIEVRSGFALSDDPDKPFGFWRGRE